MRALCVLALALLLAGCETNILARDFQREADVSCRAIGASLAALAPHRQRLPDVVEATVQTIREEAEPLCTAPDAPKGADVADRLVQMAYNLLTVEKEIQP